MGGCFEPQNQTANQPKQQKQRQSLESELETANPVVKKSEEPSELQQVAKDPSTVMDMNQDELLQLVREAAHKKKELERELEDAKEAKELGATFGAEKIAVVEAEGIGAELQQRTNQVEADFTKEMERLQQVKLVNEQNDA